MSKILRVIMSYRFLKQVMYESPEMIVDTKSLWATVKITENQFSRDVVNMVPYMHGTL